MNHKVIVVLAIFNRYCNIIPHNMKINLCLEIGYDRNKKIRNFMLIMKKVTYFNALKNVS